MNLAFCHFLLGDWQEGFRRFHNRLSHPGWRRSTPGAFWDGSDPVGKKLLLYGEGGLGNVIHFSRYAILMAERGARVVIEAPPPLLPLLKTLPGRIEIVSGGERRGDFDYQFPLMSLPAVCTHFDPLASRVPYLHADPTRAARWGERLGSERRLRVGLVWQADQRTAYGRSRSIPLESFRCLASLNHVELISLQSEWLAPPSFQLTIFPDLDADEPFSDTAAIMRNLDLVITADTATVHLAGALGVPAWVCIGYCPDWRWSLTGDISIWYPSLRLFRQEQRDDWSGPIRKIAEQLRHLKRRAG